MPLCMPPPAFLVADSETLTLKEKACKQVEPRLESRLRSIHFFGLVNYANRNESPICKIKRALNIINILYQEPSNQGFLTSILLTFEAG